jgi:hypothetical protein
VTRRRWVADPTLTWRIGLVARLASPLDADVVESRLPTTGLDGSVADEGDGLGTDALVGRVLDRDHTGLRAALSGPRLALGVDHEDCDGLGLLTVLGRLTEATLTSSARGVGNRPEARSAIRSATGRLVEALATPPARIAPVPHPSPAAGDACVHLDLPRRVSTSELVAATVDAIQAHNRAHSVRTRRIAVAIGASTTGGAAPRVADDSALLRLRRVEGLGAEELRAAIREASPEPRPPGSTGGPGAVAGLTAGAMRVLAPRLGSTVLVSHLGELDLPGVEDLAFYPVTGGGSGVSLGAAGLAGRTTLTLRGRRHRHPEALLAELGSRVRDALQS